MVTTEENSKLTVLEVLASEDSFQAVSLRRLSGEEERGTGE